MAVLNYNRVSRLLITFKNKNKNKNKPMGLKNLLLSVSFCFPRPLDHVKFYASTHSANIPGHSIASCFYFMGASALDLLKKNYGKSHCKEFDEMVFLDVKLKFIDQETNEKQYNYLFPDCIAVKIKIKEVYFGIFRANITLKQALNADPSKTEILFFDYKYLLLFVLSDYDGNEHKILKFDENFKNFIAKERLLRFYYFDTELEIITEMNLFYLLDFNLLQEDKAVAIESKSYCQETCCENYVVFNFVSYNFKKKYEAKYKEELTKTTKVDFFYKYGEIKPITVNEIKHIEKEKLNETLRRAKKDHNNISALLLFIYREKNILTFIVVCFFVSLVIILL